ncbi:MAG: hypothetical protein P1P87_03370 [Trueperaceae bacterium]|nr:hypothetical protein [Trueperaceae bacterium]
MATAMAFASALEVPADAEVLVTDAGSRIVGVGRLVGGASFELVLVEGFAGPAVVVWLTPDGGVRTTEVVVADGAVWVDDEELTSLLPSAFVAVRVRVAKELGDAWPPGVGQGPPADVPAADPPKGPPVAVDPPGPPDDLPPVADPPGPPDDGPPAGDPPGPPASPPGRPDGAAAGSRS